MQHRIRSFNEGVSTMSKRVRSVLAGFVGAVALTAPVWAAPGLPFTESFDDASLREDTGQHATTADWGGGQLKFHSANPIGVGLGPSTPSVELPNPSTTRMIQLADMNGDGHLDLVVGVAGKSFVQLNDGAGNFGAANVLPGPAANTRAVAIGDVDRDGDLDIVLGNFTTVSRLYLNDGDGVHYTLKPIMRESDVRQTDAILLVDVDHDGDLDVVTGNHGQRNQIYKNTGDPLEPFGPEGVAGSNFNPQAFVENTQALAAGDINNDGLVDLVTFNEFELNFYFLNVGNGEFDRGRPIGSDRDRSEGGALGDLNGDGYLDVVVGNTKPSANQTQPAAPSKYYINQGPAGSFLNTSAGVPLGNGRPEYGRAPVLVDIDHDGDLDILLSTAGPLEMPTEENFLFLNDGAGTFDAGTPIGMEKKNHNSIAVGDVDNDGDLDLVSGNETRDAQANAGPDFNRLYLNEPPGGSTGPAVRQLRARAASKEVDAQADPIASVRLQATYPQAALAAHNRADYWVSSDGGQNWVYVQPTNRPVLIPEGKRGADLRWRVVLHAASPGESAAPTAGAAAFALDSVDITLNSSGPTRGPIGDQSATQGSPFTLDVTFTDPDNDPITYSVSGLPLGTGLSIDPLTGVISGTPQPVDTASSPIAITVTATDGALKSEQTFNLTVAGLPGNDPPAFTSSPVLEATEGVAYSYAVTAADSDTGDTLTITGATVPAWLTLTDNGDGSATLAGTPGAADVREHSVSLVVTDAAGATATQEFTITVSPADTTTPNAPPAFTSTAPTSATVGTELVYSITAADPDAGDTLTITGTTVPAWLTLTDTGGGTATLRGTPAAANVGANAVAITVTDSAGGSATQSFTITVAAATTTPPPSSNPNPPPSSGGSGGGGGSTAPWELLVLGVLVAATLRRRQRRGAAL